MVDSDSHDGDVSRMALGKHLPAMRHSKMYTQLEEAKREIRQIMAWLNSSYLVRFEKILESRV